MHSPTCDPSRLAAFACATLALCAQGAAAQSLTTSNTNAWSGDPAHQVSLHYVPGPNSGGFDFDLAFDAGLDIGDATPVVTIPNATTTCRVPASGRVKCLVSAPSPGENLGAGDVRLSFAVRAASGTHPLALLRAGFYDQTGSPESGVAAPGSVAIEVQPGLSIADASITEGNAGTSLLGFVITLSPASNAPVEFNVTTVAGTAQPGVDFDGVAAMPVTIPAGQTSTLVTIPIHGDTTPESAETLVVEMNTVTGAAVADSQALGTIRDDDGATLQIADAVSVEGDAGQSAMIFTVTLSSPLPVPVTFDIDTAGGTAAGGADFVQRHASRTIDAGRTQATFEVSVVGDTVDEVDESFSVVLSKVAGATLADANALATIVDDDAPGASVSIAQVQGSGNVSPLVGLTVTVEGIVTALTGEGFFLQSARQDSDPSTSEGIFVPTRNQRINVGDRVRLTGQVVEVLVGARTDQLSQTQIAASALQVLARGAALPAAAPMDVAVRAGMAIDALEPLEGMRVESSGLRVVGPTGWGWPSARSRSASGRFFVVPSAVARTYEEAGASPLLVGHAQGGRPVSDGNAERLLLDSAAQRGGQAVAADVGDTIPGVAGVLGYGEGTYRFLPDPVPGLAIRSRARTSAAPRAARGELSVALMSFDGIAVAAAPNSARGVGRDYAVRVAKAANAVCTSAGTPDIVAVDGEVATESLEELADAINGGDPWALFGTECRPGVRYEVRLAPDADGPLRRAFLVDTGRREGRPDVRVADVRTLRVQGARGAAVGQPTSPIAAAALDLELETVDGQTMPLTLVSADAAGIQDAIALHGVVAREQGLGHSRMLLLAGLGAPPFDAGEGDVVRIISDDREGGLSNLLSTLPRPERYNAVQDGNAVALDHALASAPLLLAAKLRLSIPRINADFGDDNADDALVPMRVSSRDPLVVYITPR